MDVKKIVKRKINKLLLASCSADDQIISSSSPSRKRTNWVRLPFLGHFSYRMAQILKKYNYRVAYYPLLTLSHLTSLKDSTPLMDRCGVYQIKCPCGARQGEISTNVTMSIRDVRCSQPLHQLKPYDINDTTLSILHPATEGRLFNRLEEIEVTKALHSAPGMVNVTKQ